MGSQSYHLHVLTVQKLWDPQPSEALRACLDLYKDTLTFISLIESLLGYVSYINTICPSGFRMAFVGDA